MTFGATSAFPAGAVAGAPAVLEAAGKPAPDGLSENEIQKACFQHLRLRPAPNIFAFHPKNASADMAGRKRGIHVGLGVEPGITDVITIELVLPLAGDLLPLCRVYALELKRWDRRGKKPTAHEVKQMVTRDRMAAAGCVTGIAYGLAEAIAWLEHHGLLRGSMS